jgi:hypothetical protein
MMKKIFFLVVCIQLIVITTILLYIIKNKSSQIISTNLIDSKSIRKTPRDSLKHFYEPARSNITEKIDRDWLSYVPEYTLNIDSLNERFNYEVQKKQKVFRIITLGDSFTWGAYVSTEDNWTELLEDRLNKDAICSQVKKYEVINLGVDGYDSAYEVERYKIRGMKYTPDLLIMLVVDFMRMTDYRIEHYRMFSPLEVKIMKEKGIFYPGMNEDAKLTDAIRISYQYPQFEKLLNLYSGEILIVDHEKNPKGTIFYNDLSKKYPNFIYSKTTFPIFDRKTSLPDGHPNKDGHKALSVDIFQLLIKNKVIPCLP